jgi:hypothetical protein
VLQRNPGDCDHLAEIKWMADHGVRPAGYQSSGLRQEADRTSENNQRANRENDAGDQQEKRGQIKRIRQLLRRQQQESEARKGADHGSKAWIEPCCAPLRNVTHRIHHNRQREENQRADLREGAKDEGSGEHRWIGPDKQRNQRDPLGQRWQHLRHAKRKPGYNRSGSE